MVTLTFEFNKEKLAQEGLTEDELLRPMREHAAKYGIRETSPGVFEKDGEDAYCAVGMAVPKIADSSPDYLYLLDVWTFNVDGDVEDCIEEVRKWREEQRRYSNYKRWAVV